MPTKFHRWQKETILKAMESRRVILLAGARQCGKTTLARELDDYGSEYRTLDDFTLRQAAASDPQGFLKHDKQFLIIDEIQRVPDLLPAIKKVVDENTTSGQFLLTGSANIQSLPNVQESLAGRIAKLRLRPLAIGEIKGSEPTFLDRAFRGRLKAPKHHVDRDELIALACAGGFPEGRLLEGRQRRRWHRDYIDAMMDRDLRDITRIHRQDAMRQLMDILAAWSSKFMNIAGIGASLSIQKPTLLSYINAIEALYLIERVKPWAKTDYDRVGKHHKLFMADSGLMASLLGWNEEQIRFDSDRSGKLIETFAFNELAALVDASDGKYELFHYRDREKREIDFIIEREDGALLGIEIKAGSAVRGADFKHQRWFKQNLAGERPYTGIALYSGEHQVSFGDGMLALPFGSLWTDTPG